MSNHKKSCGCPRCAAEIKFLIRWAFLTRHEWLGMYQAKIASGLGWIDHSLYASLFHELVDGGELIQITAGDPNSFPVYLPAKLCGSHFEPYPVTCFLVPVKGDAVLCQPSTN
jgi:hypothetical protein